MAVDNQQNSSMGKIRALLTVLISGVVCAFLVSGLLLYYYGPSGRYLVKNALLAPELMTSLAYNDTNKKTGGNSRFVFDGIEFSFYDDQAKMQRLIQISPGAYKNFYDLVMADKSLLNVPEAVLALFEKAATILTIKVRTESHAAWQDETKVFQVVQFSDEGNHYRIKLHEEPSPNEWVYYSHPDILTNAIHTLIPQL